MTVYENGRDVKLSTQKVVIKIRNPDIRIMSHVRSKQLNRTASKIPRTATSLYLSVFEGSNQRIPLPSLSYHLGHHIVTQVKSEGRKPIINTNNSV